MLLQNILSVLALASCLAEAKPTPGRGGRKGKGGGNQGAGAATSTAAGDDSGSLTLNPAAVQTGSNQDGQQVQEAGQIASLTSADNFINFCVGKTLTNGQQVKTGSCNGITMGDIPDQDHMISSLLVSPSNGDKIQSDTNFTVSVQTVGLVAGAFTNAQTTYYSAPQQLSGKNIIGHTHITIQQLTSKTVPPDPKTFAFFKGINDAGNGKGLLSANVTGGLPTGTFRICTLTSAMNHQPVLMPMAQRGGQDDCIQVEMIGNGQIPNVLSSEVKAEEAASSAAAAKDTKPTAAPSGAGTGKDVKGNGGKAVTETTTAAPAAATDKAGKAGHGHHKHKGKTYQH